MSLGPAPFAILSHPWPYKAWLAIANDPDNTLIEDWRELDKFIWQELQLPFADSVFVESHNKNLPGQVNLSDHPELARAHPIDTVHTWGDYMHGGRRGFDREDALRAMDLLAQYNLEPQVWTDHASFQGNLLHNFQGGGIPWTEDRSGHRYENYFYTLDLILELGVHYAWDGTIERSFDRRKATALRPQTFTDGNKLQVFTRYGTWQDADIDGLANLLSETHVQSMLDEGGAYVLYTHLGKRPAQRLNDTRHIPHQSRRTLQRVAQLYQTRELMLSSTTELLDHIVLRDSMKWNHQDRCFEFEPDGLRFNQITGLELRGHSFTFSSESGPPTLKLNGEVLSPHWRSDQKNLYTVAFK